MVLLAYRMAYHETRRTGTTVSAIESDRQTEMGDIERARMLARLSLPAESPDERSVPHYLQSIALSLADIAETLRLMEGARRG